jgi:hypothetical protein
MTVAGCLRMCTPLVEFIGTKKSFLGWRCDSKNRVLSSNPSNTKKKKKKE